MQHRDGYLNSKIADISYLLPYGQNVADHAAGIRTNSIGEQLWEAILDGADRADLIALLAESCHAEDEDMPGLEKDLDVFLSMLYSNDLLLSRDTPKTPAFEPYYVQIGPLKLSLSLPEALCNRYFKDFSCAPCETEAPAQQVRCFLYEPRYHENGTILIRNEEILIFETPEHYILLPQVKSCIYELPVTRDGALADLYCQLDLTAENFDEIFHFLRFAFLVVAQQHELYVVHSASVLYRDKAWLFSGHSGAGKSTQAQLWNRLFSAETLNGDLNLIGIEGQTPMCYGLPWCGTSGIYTPKCYPLGGIIFLRQARENLIVSPLEEQKRLHLLHRMISPSWTREQLLKNLAFCERLIPLTTVRRLYCTPDAEAALLTKATIDESIK